MEANRRSEMHGLSAAERREAKIQQAQANEQIALLERGTATGGSDFSTYRYLATEGFLPGYNFPRLPLYAYVPAVDRRRPEGCLSAARALHRHRRVRPAQPDLSRGPRLSRLQGQAAAGHPRRRRRTPCDRHVSMFATNAAPRISNDEPERCHACQAPMGGIHPIRNVLRIDNVETQPAERITANDEDRQRQGFEIQTVFAWPRRDGAARCDARPWQAMKTGPILSLDYAPGATISRLNKGLRRRKEKSIFGFGIDPATGRWTGSKSEGDDDDARQAGTSSASSRSSRTTRTRCCSDCPRRHSPKPRMATLQHALARGLEVVFQLEEGEMSDRAVPSRDRRRAILALRGNRRRRRRARSPDERCRGARAGRADGAGADALSTTSMQRRSRQRSGRCSPRSRTPAASRAATAACCPTTTSPITS